MIEMTRRQYSEWLGRGWFNSCRNKKRMDEIGARLKAAELSGKKRGELSPYECLHCGGWHIGHTPPPGEYGIVIVESTPTAKESRITHALEMKGEAEPQ